MSSTMVAVSAWSCHSLGAQRTDREARSPPDASRDTAAMPGGGLMYVQLFMSVHPEPGSGWGPDGQSASRASRASLLLLLFVFSVKGLRLVADWLLTLGAPA